MNLEILCCTACRGPLERSTEGLRCPVCVRIYPVVGDVPRFVPRDVYGPSFGLQWNRFRQTQLDSFSGTSLSRERFLKQTGWNPDSLAGSLVLDAGCGAGRFAEVALSFGAQVVAVDASTAVDACWANLGARGGIDVVQADLYALPFRPGSFECVYCLGVLQHTPDPERALKALAEQVKPGGRLVVDVYEKNLRALLHPKWLFRLLAAHVKPDVLLGIIERWAPRLLRMSSRLGRVPLVGRYLRRAIPVANYEGTYALGPEQLEQWAVLDTYDWLAPRFDNPQTKGALKHWLEEMAFDQIEIFSSPHLTARARRANAPGH